MRLKNQQGAVLITLIVAMTLMAALGVGIYSLTTSSSFGEFMANRNDNAYDLARAGIRYGVSLRTFTLSATTFKMPDDDHLFTVEIASGVITSTGVVNPGTFLEARRRLTYNVSWAPTPLSDTISFTGDMASFGSPIINNPSAIQVSQDNKSVNLGGGVTDSYGSLWYQGSSGVGFCTNGQCSFGTGIRAYFDFTCLNEDSSSDSTNSADGFTFAVMSAIANPRDRTSGAAPGVSQGELMGYAGPDNTTDTLGLLPPKMALEFDTYPNNTTSDICAAESRNDPDPFSNHAALMFWGSRTISGTCSGGYSKSSYDDNRHGAGGSGSDPINSATASDLDYYAGVKPTCKNSSNSCNWMEDGYPYSVRMEIVRPLTVNGSGTYDYQINAWVMRSSAVPSGSVANFQNVTAPYVDSAPQIIRTVSLSQTDHDNFSKIYFGFTEATGGVSQQITLSNFRTSFPQGTGECSYGISPANATFAATGGTGSVTVTATAACPWWAATVNTGYTSWLHITSGGTGNGNGTVSYTVDANSGPARTGYMTIAGQTFTVTQAVSACAGYRVWNNTGSTWDFKVTGQSCRTNRADGSEITTSTASTQLQSGETVSRYTTAGGGCSSAVQGSITYEEAVNADTNGNCRINYNSGDVPSDR